MAKKKKSHHSKPVRHHRKARMSGIGNFHLMDTLQTGAGLVVGTMVGTMAQKYFTSVNSKIVSGVSLAVGIMNTHRPNKIVSGAAWGLAASGAIGLAHETGILHGVDEMVSGMMLGDGQSNGSYGEIEYKGDGMSGMYNDTVLSGMANGTTLGDSPAPVADQYYAPTMGY
jgi:hypothetical protein